VPADFHVGIVNDGERATAMIRGELDQATAPKLTAAVTALLEVHRVDVTFDLKEMTFVDSSGLAVIVAAARTLRSAGGDLQLINPRPAVRRTFELSALDRALHFGGDA